jgi:hypothetical protein
MGLNAGKGQVVHQNVVHTLSRYISNTDLSGTLELGWLPANSAVISSGVAIKTAWSGTGNEQIDLGFDQSEEGYTTDPNAFTETALDLDAAVGHIAGDVVSAANLYFTKPARVTGTIVNTDSATGAALVYVTYVVRQTP